MVSFSCSLHPILGRPVLKAPLELLWGPSLWQPGSSRDHHFVFKRLKVFEPPSLRFLGMEINSRLYVELNYVDICLVGNLVSHNIIRTRKAVLSMRCGQRPCPTLVSPGGGWQLLPLGAQGLQAGPGSAQCDGLNWSAALSVRLA